MKWGLPFHFSRNPGKVFQRGRVELLFAVVQDPHWLRPWLLLLTARNLREAGEDLKLDTEEGRLRSSKFRGGKREPLERKTFFLDISVTQNELTKGNALKKVILPF